MRGVERGGFSLANASPPIFLAARRFDTSHTTVRQWMRGKRAIDLLSCHMDTLIQHVEQSFSGAVSTDDDGGGGMRGWMFHLLGETVMVPNIKKELVEHS